jgi:hypothetical protein
MLTVYAAWTRGSLKAVNASIQGAMQAPAYAARAEQNTAKPPLAEPSTMATPNWAIDWSIASDEKARSLMKTSTWTGGADGTRRTHLRNQQVADLPTVPCPCGPPESPNWSLEWSLENQLPIDPGTPRTDGRGPSEATPKATALGRCISSFQLATHGRLRSRIVISTTRLIEDT